MKTLILAAAAILALALTTTDLTAEQRADGGGAPRVSESERAVGDRPARRADAGEAPALRRRRQRVTRRSRAGEEDGRERGRGRVVQPQHREEDLFAIGDEVSRDVLACTAADAAGREHTGRRLPLRRDGHARRLAPRHVLARGGDR